LMVSHPRFPMHRTLSGAPGNVQDRQLAPDILSSVTRDLAAAA
jgi:hypothetical protein